METKNYSLADKRLGQYDVFWMNFLRKEFFLNFFTHNERLFTILKHAWFGDITENIPLPEQLPKCNEIVRCYLQKMKNLDYIFWENSFNCFK